MNQLDIFGSQVSVRFQGSQIHKTKFGAFLTIILCSLIFIRLGILISSAINGRNPTVLYQERQVSDPKMFVITPNTLSLALGVLDIGYKYYIDSSIFTIQGVHKIRKNVYNTTTGKYDQAYKSTKFNLVNCTDDHVPDPQLREFFVKSQLYMHQCIPKDQIVEIEGQFNSDTYQAIDFYITKCAGQGCKSKKEIDALVNNTYIELLFTDVYFAPENKDDPFVRYSRDLYWITSQNLPREVNVFMRNNYVESDLGWVTPDISTQIYPSFSYDDNQIVDTSNSFFFHLVVRFEKEKENLYKRTYDNLFTIMSQIGGFSQILLIIFSFVCLRYSKIHLGRSLINQSFEFQDITNKANQGTLIYSTNQKQNESEIIQNQSSQNKQKYKFYNPSPIQQNSFQLTPFQRDPGSPILVQDLKVSKVDGSQQYEHEDTSQQINKRHIQNLKQLTDEEIMKDYNKQKEVTQNKSNLNFNIFSYMLSFVARLFKSFRNKKQVIDYGFKEIDNNLDIEYIIKKFVEIDKLKRIILNDDQLTLFNYIPKPQILYKVDTTQGVVIEKNSFFNKDDNLNDFEKFKQAKQSFKNIFEKQKQTKIDCSILNLLDAKQYEILSNQLDKKQFQQKQNQMLQEMQFSRNLQSSSPVSPKYLLCKQNSDLEEIILENKFKSEDIQLSNKLNKYSTNKKVRNPSIYSSIINQEQKQEYTLQNVVEENL